MATRKFLYVLSLDHAFSLVKLCELILDIMFLFNHMTLLSHSTLKTLISLNKIHFSPVSLTKRGRY